MGPAYGVSSFDGTITADIPAARLTELFNCNNFIVSQVNPHINFVLHLAEEGQGRRLQQARSGDRRAAVSKLLRVANFLLLNIKYGVQKLLEAGEFTENRHSTDFGCPPPNPRVGMSIGGLLRTSTRSTLHVLLLLLLLRASV